MAYKARDGKQFGNNEQGKFYDKVRGEGEQDNFPKSEKSGEQDSAEGSAEGESAHDHEGKEGDHSEIDNVVAEHGPATEITTTHEDGHKHHSKGHPHAGHAAEHTAHAFGEAEPQEAPKGEEQAEEEAVPGIHKFIGA